MLFYIFISCFFPAKLFLVLDLREPAMRGVRKRRSAWLLGEIIQVEMYHFFDRFKLLMRPFHSRIHNFPFVCCFAAAELCWATDVCVFVSLFLPAWQ